jgi:hypothetical protein
VVDLELQGACEGGPFLDVHFGKLEARTRARNVRD